MKPNTKDSTPTLQPPTKRCTKCGVTKPASDFYTLSYKGVKSPQSHCKKCVAARATARNKRVLEQRVQSEGGGVACPVCGQHVFEISNRHAASHGYATATELVAAHGGAVAGEQKQAKSKAACDAQWAAGDHDNNAEAASKELTKRWETDEWREKMRAVSAANPNRIPYTTRTGDVIRCLSLAETFVAFLLDYAGVAYTYESETVTLSDGTTYTPDFVTLQAFLEVKGALGRDRIPTAQAAARQAQKELLLVDVSTVHAAGTAMVRLTQYLYRYRATGNKQTYRHFAALAAPSRGTRGARFSRRTRLAYRDHLEAVLGAPHG